MGGNALKNTLRLDKKDYFKISNEIMDILNRKNIIYYIPLSFKNKPNFGDLDVLLKKNKDFDLYKFVLDNFNPNENYVNGNCISFKYKNFQIDFISVKEKFWETSKHYFSYNDLGNFMGRIAYNMGFRYGDYGLKFVYRHENTGVKFEKLISTNPKEIFNFLGFNYERFLEGFVDLNDIFDYIIGSKYFTKKIFDYDQLNHQNKTRNKKRKNYQLFLNYISNIKDKEVLKFNKEESLEYCENYFKLNLKQEIDCWKKEIERKKLISSKFNGHFIMSKFPNIKGKRLGILISEYKKRDDYDSFIINNDIEYIIEDFKKFLNESNIEIRV